MPHKPHPSTSATATVSREPDYDSDGPNPGLAVDKTTIMLDLSVDIPSPTPLQVIKKIETSTPASSGEPSLMNLVIKRSDKGWKMTEQLGSLLKVMSKKSKPAENQHRTLTDWLDHKAMKMHNMISSFSK